MLSRRFLTRKDRLELANRAGGPAALTLAETEENVSRYLDTLAKVIPPEIVAAFLAIDGVFRDSTPRRDSDLYWWIFAFLSSLCAWYAYRMAQTPALTRRPIREAIVGTLGFIVWAYAIGGPFAYAPMEGYDAALGGVFAILYTLLVPLAANR